MSGTPAWGARALLLLAVLTVVFATKRESAIAAGEHQPASLRACRVCHDLSSEKKSQGFIGPPLWGVANRSIGSENSFAGYSETLVSMGAHGKIWDRRTLERYLADPRMFAPGCRMAFTGIADEKSRMQAVDYLFSMQD
ncbi:cytochrome c, class I [Magnetococcus marinus MC-1]|uniref:Cytochrome c, class I n=1 Tax=Magnetococcus marinus (strain ATCC BAA-1437 / JCM 17883 / MC-1) TaxID=156889 RepID=A0LDB6_MAGMM|nr:cytochrome C, class I [Magnetococcus marinus]ABK45959.1 cytochrome c, class I [Magnetococcus marinus MC-1]